MALDDAWLVGIAPSLDITGMAEFYRYSSGSRGGGSVHGRLELVFENDARVGATAGLTALGAFRIWTFGVTGEIPF